MEEEHVPRHVMATEVISILGHEPSPSNIEQMQVYLDAFDVFLERNSRYEDLWRDYGWMDNLTHVRSKALRLVRKFWRNNAPEANDNMLDDAVDLINYTAFFIRNYCDRNKWGRA
jgi:hypothetical protein